jgi:hypothetical protein
MLRFMRWILLSRLTAVDILTQTFVHIILCRENVLLFAAIIFVVYLQFLGLNNSLSSRWKA